MDAFAMTEIVDQHRQNGEFYHEFLRKERLSVGLYVLEAGATDPQSPHTEDEIYYIVSGAGIIEVDGEAGQLALVLLFSWAPALPIASIPSLKTSA